MHHHIVYLELGNIRNGNTWALLYLYYSFLRRYSCLINSFAFVQCTESLQQKLAEEYFLSFKERKCHTYVFQFHYTTCTHLPNLPICHAHIYHIYVVICWKDDIFISLQFSSIPSCIYIIKSTVHSASLLLKLYKKCQHKRKKEKLCLCRVTHTKEEPQEKEAKKERIVKYSLCLVSSLLTPHQNHRQDARVDKLYISKYICTFGT